MNGRYFNSGRFGYAIGYRSRTAAEDTFDSMCAEGEISPCEGRVESYLSQRDGKTVTRYAVTIGG